MSIAVAALILIAASSPADAIRRDNRPSPQYQRAADEDVARQAIRRAYSLVQANAIRAAEEAIDEVMRSPSFPKLPAEDRYAADLLAGSLALDREDADTAHRLLVRATEFKGAESPAWRNRFRAAFQRKNYVDAGRSVAHIAKHWPKTLADVSDHAIFLTAFHLEEPKDDDTHRDFLESLFDAKWTGSDDAPDSLWVDLTRLLLAHGDLRKAEQVAAAIHAPLSIVSLRVDRRFDRIVQKDPKRFDVGRAVDSTLAKAQAAARAAPDRLQPLTQLQSYQLQALQFEQAIAVADEVIAKIAGKDGANIYKDFDEQYVWILDQRAEALSWLGRWDDALKQREKAARRPERGHMNVSQVINLGMLYVTLGRPGDALDAVAEVGDMSPYGRVQLEHVRLDAAVQLHDTEAVAKHLDYLREHRTDAIGTWQTALLVAGDMDGSANLLVERLGREDWRNQALVEMQNYAELPPTPILSKRLAQWKALLTRPEVRAALEKAGRIESFKLSGPRS